MFIDLRPSTGRKTDSPLSLAVGLNIAGRVTKLNINFPCNVRLYERLTGNLVAQVQTDTLGNYQFVNLKTGFEFTLVAHDHQRQYNAVISDMVKPA